MIRGQHYIGFWEPQSQPQAQPGLWRREVLGAGDQAMGTDPGPRVDQDELVSPKLVCVKLGIWTLENPQNGFGFPFGFPLKRPDKGLSKQHAPALVQI